MHPAIDLPAIECPHGPRRADVAQRRIGAARALWARCSRRPHALGLDDDALEPLEAAIEGAERAAWALAATTGARGRNEAGLRRALEALRCEQEDLERAIAAFALERKDPSIRAMAGLSVSGVRRREWVDLHAVIQRARRVPEGGVELSIVCPRLGEANGLWVQVLRQKRPGDPFEDIGRAWQPIYVDATARQCDRVAAYRVYACHKSASGPISRRVFVPIPRPGPAESPADWNVPQRRAAA